MYLVSDKSSNAAFFQIFTCELITPKLDSSPIVVYYKANNSLLKGSQTQPCPAFHRSLSNRKKT